jgi:hypothetical protein
MGEPAARRLPWGLVITVALLALLVLAVYRAGPGPADAAPWRVVISAGLLAAGAFLVVRRLQNYFWGVVAALVLALHPLHWDWSGPFVLLALSAEAMEVLVLAGVAAGWDLAPSRQFGWGGWLGVGLAVVVGAGLAWPAVPQAGLVTALLTAVGLPLGALLGRRTGERPSWGNTGAAVLLGVAGPVLGLLLASGSVRALNWSVAPGLGADPGPGDFLAAAVGPDAAGADVRAYATERLHRWAWPAVWAVLPLVALGLWCAVRRGLKQLAARRLPLPWVLVLYTFAELVGLVLRPRGLLETVVLPLAGLTLLLAVFGLAEVVRVVTRPLVLLPPGERAAHE